MSRRHCQTAPLALPALGALLLTAAAPFAQAELVDIIWKDGGRFDSTMTVAPGKFAEVCGALRQGQTVAWSFDAQAALNFNIHYHVDKDVHYPARQDQVGSLKGELAVRAAQDYCWMWTNKSGKPVRLDLSLALK